MLNQVKGLLVDLLVLMALQELYLIQALEKKKRNAMKQGDPGVHSVPNPSSTLPPIHCKTLVCVGLAFCEQH